SGGIIWPGAQAPGSGTIEARAMPVRRTAPRGVSLLRGCARFEFRSRGFRPWLLTAARVGAALAVTLLVSHFCPPTARADGNSTAPVERLTRSSFPKFFLQYAPDGSRLAYCRHHENRRAANKILVGARIVRADGTDDRPLLPEYETQVQVQEHPAWSSDGKRL